MSGESRGIIWDINVVGVGSAILAVVDDDETELCESSSREATGCIVSKGGPGKNTISVI